MILYSVCKFGDSWSTNPGDYVVTNCIFEDDSQKLAFPTRYLRKYWTARVFHSRQWSIYNIFK